MITKQLTKKLTLSKTTVTNLNPEEMNRSRGGAWTLPPRECRTEVQRTCYC